MSEAAKRVTCLFLVRTNVYYGFDGGELATKTKTKAGYNNTDNSNKSQSDNIDGNRSSTANVPKDKQSQLQVYRFY